MWLECVVGTGNTPARKDTFFFREQFIFYTTTYEIVHLKHLGLSLAALSLKALSTTSVGIIYCSSLRNLCSNSSSTSSSSGMVSIVSSPDITSDYGGEGCDFFLYGYVTRIFLFLSFIFFNFGASI